MFWGHTQNWTIYSLLPKTLLASVIPTTLYWSSSNCFPVVPSQSLSGIYFLLTLLKHNGSQALSLASTSMGIPSVISSLIIN